MRFLYPAILSLVITTAATASLVYMDTAQLADESTLVVVGEIESIESFYGDDGYIYSRAYVDVEHFVLGDGTNGVVEVIYPGGIVGDIGMTTSISPDFEEGMDVLLFLKNNDEGEFVLVNHAGSKFTIEDGVVVEIGISLGDYMNEINAAANR
jgi:hypothetical protein